MSQTLEDLKAEIADLELQLERLTAQLPAHSISPALMTALDELIRLSTYIRDILGIARCGASIHFFGYHLQVGNT
jgi:hypothetical protein